MHLAALVSGGKDSIYAMVKCREYGHVVDVLLNLQPPHLDEEEDSHMFQFQSFEVLRGLSECTGIPLMTRRVSSDASHGDKSLTYEGGGGATKRDDEVEDLYELLLEMRRAFPQVQGVCSGAVLSTYQRCRVENVCGRAGLTSLAPLWQREQSALLEEMVVRAGVKAVIVKAASLGLGRKHVGRVITREMVEEFRALEAQFGFHACGEGGEYETLAVDCPRLFTRGTIELVETEVKTMHDAGFVSTYCLKIKKWRVIERELPSPSLAGGDDATTTRNPGPPTLPRLASSTTSSPSSSTSSFRVWDATSIAPDSSSSLTFLGPFFGDDAVATLTHVQDLIDRIPFVYLYFRDLSDFVDVNTSYERFFASRNDGGLPPARCATEAPPAFFAGAPSRTRFAMMFVVMTPPEDLLQREALQVRSLSEWAPLCIGPYSQANWARSKENGKITSAWIAGQIAFTPFTMTLVTSSRADELRRCVQNAAAVSKTIWGSDAIATKSAVVVYVSTRRGTETINTGEKAFCEMLVECLTQMLPSWCRAVVVAVPALPRNASFEVEVMGWRGGEHQMTTHVSRVFFNALRGGPEVVNEVNSEKGPRLLTPSECDPTHLVRDGNVVSTSSSVIVISYCT